MSAPDRIYLQVGPEDEGDFPDPTSGEVTWCQDRVFQTDVEYVRANKLKESEESPGEWTCQRCGENVPAAWVTYQETHEGCGGECI